MIVLRSMLRVLIAAAVLAAAGASSAGALPLNGMHAPAANEGAIIKVHAKKYRHHHRRDHYVDAPFTRVDKRRRHVVVDAPFANVYVGRHGRYVRAPFVELWRPY